MIAPEVEFCYNVRQLQVQTAVDKARAAAFVPAAFNLMDETSML